MNDRIAKLRKEKDWSQEQLAERAGVPRSTVSAVEVGRMEPGVSTAMALATALGSTVEELFSKERNNPLVRWLTPPQSNLRYWQAEIGGNLINIPCESHFGLMQEHDGMAGEHKTSELSGKTDRTLVIAGCDPALALLPDLLQSRGMRVLLLHRSSGAALELLKQGLIHVAACHLGTPARGNNQAVRKQIQSGWTLLRAHEWEEGVALHPGVHLKTSRDVLAAGLRWVGREEGSGARRCADRFLAHASQPVRPRAYAADHRGVAAAIRHGWAQAGVCIRLAASEAGLNFVPLQHEAVDLCFAQASVADSRIRALVEEYQSARLRKLLGVLPGYDISTTGQVKHVV